MSAARDPQLASQPPDDILAVTWRGVVERLADPYLTDHDRWMLGQFARFLSGATPDPDPRVLHTRPGPLHRRFRRNRV